MITLEQLRPLEDRVIVEAIESEDKTPGGIIIPDQAKEKSNKGKVIAVGPGRQLDDGDWSDMSVKVGDTVLYNKHAGSDLEVDGKKIKVLRELEIFAVLD